MKKCGPEGWLEELIYEEELSKESIYAIHTFLERLLLHFENKASRQLGSYWKEQEEINRCLYEFSNNEDPF